MSRRVIEAIELFARLGGPEVKRDRLGRAVGKGRRGIPLAEKTAIVRRILDGEDPRVVALEIGRSPATLLAWCSYYRCRTDVWRGYEERSAFTVIEGGVQ